MGRDKHKLPDLLGLAMKIEHASCTCTGMWGLTLLCEVAISVNKLRGLIRHEKIYEVLHVTD